LLICPVFIPLIQNLGIEIQRALNKHRFRSFLYIGIAGANLLMSIPLTMAFGVKGAAMGTCVSLLIGNGLIMNLYNHFRVGLDMVYFWKQILRLLLPGAGALVPGMALGAYLTVDSPAEFILAGAGYSLAYAVLEWRFGLNDREKRLVAEPLGKVLNRMRVRVEKTKGK
ncbi:MAG TPA: polysaccharide biosynthesis C-terminal domain-containing protein, partial [Candidatus Mediterraneibacter cottocaccae]|nr:polysaccharide biosynthesis C-terminal domain-containing protein [Candidatus Mediterraneibacter cottocaccae]